MAGSVNKVILVGNLGDKPEVRTMQNGGRVANFSLATSESWKDRNSGERQERTQWHRVVVFNDGIVNVCENYLQKGSKVYLEGQLETRKWQGQDGRDNYTTEVVLRPYRGELTMLDSRSNSGYNQQMGNQGGYQQQPQAMGGGMDTRPLGSGSMPQGGQSAASGLGVNNLDSLDDDIPF